MKRNTGDTLRAGFGRAEITPPLGTRMFGWGARDETHGCDSIHDGLFTRALWLQQGSENALIMGFDLLFFSRDVADRLRGAIARRFGLHSMQILLNTSHTHSGPTTGTWYTALFSPPDHLYLDRLERAVLDAADKARRSLTEVSLSAGVAKTRMMVRRRRPDGKGGVEWKPYAEGVHDSVPLCLFKDSLGKPVCLLFSVSCHPSTFPGHAISADYPGVAMAELDKHLGAECSLFLQGAGGDSKVRGFVDTGRFGSTWEDVQMGGQMAAADVIEALESGLQPVSPSLSCAETEAELPFVELPSRAELEKTASEDGNPAKRMWAGNVLARLDRAERLPDRVPIGVHVIQISEDVRIAGLEAEVVADWGRIVERFYGAGVTFVLGYTDGCQLYLPTTAMISEGGYEVESFWEYHWPAQLAPGMEERILEALSVAGRKMRDQG